MQYYYPELDIDGTPESLLAEVKNGYMEDPKTLRKTEEILLGEGMDLEARYVRWHAEKAENDAAMNVADLKIGFFEGCTGSGSVNLRGCGEEPLLATVAYERDCAVLVLEEGCETGAAALPYKELLEMSQKDFDRFLNQTYFYNMRTC